MSWAIIATDGLMFLFLMKNASPVAMSLDTEMVLTWWLLCLSSSASACSARFSSSDWCKAFQLASCSSAAHTCTNARYSCSRSHSAVANAHSPVRGLASKSESPAVTMAGQSIARPSLAEAPMDLSLSASALLVGTMGAGPAATIAAEADTQTEIESTA